MSGKQEIRAAIAKARQSPGKEPFDIQKFRQVYDVTMDIGDAPLTLRNVEQYEEQLPAGDADEDAAGVRRVPSAAQGARRGLSRSGQLATARTCPLCSCISRRPACEAGPGGGGHLAKAVGAPIRLPVGSWSLY